MNILNKCFRVCHSVFITNGVQSKPHVYALVLLSLTGTTQMLHASGCVRAGNPAHMRMFANADIKLSGNIQKNQEIGRFQFTKDASGTANIATTCKPGSTIYALAGAGEPTQGSARHYDDIDGMPAYYLPRSNNEYAYVLIDNESGLPFGNKQDYSTIPIDTDKMLPRQATLILYATLDNPTFSMALGNIELGGLKPEVGDYTTGYTYKFQTGSIDAAAVSCDINNPNNLSITLPHSPISAFNDIGDTHAKAGTQLGITCTGDMQAKISLRLDSNQVESDDYGQDTVIKNERESGDYAKGIGFVLSIDGERLIDDSWVDLPDLGKGTVQIPIDAEYYRYGYETSAGKVQAIANFIVEFN